MSLFSCGFVSTYMQRRMSVAYYVELNFSHIRYMYTVHQCGICGNLWDQMLSDIILRVQFRSHGALYKGST